MKTEVSKRVLRLALFLVFAFGVIAFTTLRVVHPLSLGARNPTELSPASKEKARKLLLDGVGSQVSLASPGAGFDQVQASVDSVQAFIRGRSGLQLDPDVAARLAQMEQRTLNGGARRISCDDLSDSALAILVDRFRNSTDAEIEKAADGLSNVKTVSQSTGARSQSASSNAASGSGSKRASISDRSTQLPDTSDRIMLRANGQGVMSRRDFIDQALRYRIRMNAPAQLIAILGIVRPAARQVFRNRLAVLSQALPEQWAAGQAQGLTPVQAFILTYSVAADDPLYRSKPGLDTAMQWVEGVNRRTDSGYPTSLGRLPYGSNGYLFSSPLNLILDKPTTNRLLDRLTERTSK